MKHTLMPPAGTLSLSDLTDESYFTVLLKKLDLKYSN
jgi:hypothetical protein